MQSFYLALQSLGDCLISLQLLQRSSKPLDASLQVVGTSLTRQVATIMGPLPFTIVEILPHVAAFYDLRKAGVAPALRDARIVRRKLLQIARDDDRVLFEKRDWRNGLLTPRRLQRIEPPLGTSIYQDRQRMLGQLFGGQAPLKPCRKRPRDVRTVVFNPGAKQSFRALPSTVVDNVVDYATKKGIQLCLLDLHGRYREAGRRAHQYELAPPLEHAIELLRKADLFVGADSFFLHLAYYYDVPLFAIPRVANPYFAPPGMLEQNCYLPVAEAHLRDTLFTALDLGSE